MSRLVRLLSGAMVAAAFALAPAAAASADAPVITTQTFTRSGDFLDGNPCPGTSAHILFTGEITARYWRCRHRAVPIRTKYMFIVQPSCKGSTVAGKCRPGFCTANVVSDRHGRFGGSGTGNVGAFCPGAPKRAESVLRPTLG